MPADISYPWLDPAERASGNTLRPGEEAEMNVILVTMCGLRPDHLGCCGNAVVRTPALDRFARESLVFDRACPETLPMIPARHALFTGMRLYPFKKAPSSSGTKLPVARSGPSVLPSLTVPGWAPMPLNMVTVSEMLYPRYRTALFSDAPPYFSCARMDYHRGFAHFDWVRGQILDAYGVPCLANRIDMSRYVPPWFANDWYALALPRYLANTLTWQAEDDHYGPQLFSRAARWLDDSRGSDEPFFLVVDSWDPREPWDPPPPYVDLYDPGYRGLEMILPFYGPTRLMSDAELNHMRALYAAKVSMVDTWFGRFMDKVRGLGLLENTMIIVTSDHGLQLGEHGISGECPAGMYPELINCVLMVRHPRGTGSGKRSQALVQHHDIAATILGFLEVRPPHELDGFDLTPIIEGRGRPVRDHATCAYAMNVWCRDSDFVLICRNTGEEPQLFDLGNDPLQMQNAAWDKPRVVKRMYDLMLEDARGGPIAPDYALPNPKVFQGVRWLDWSPYRPFLMP
jgi:arylsulfatase A-like enzyme